MASIPRIQENVKLTELYQLHSERAEILELADGCLERFNRYWAAWIISGDDGAFRQAMNAQQDRKQLLAQMGIRP